MSKISTKLLVQPTLLALAAAACVSSFAQENTQTLSEVVVSASGFEQQVTEAPASISVITQEELSTRPYTSLVDAVRDLEGIDIGETSDKTGQKTISMRGMGSDYTLILVDGKRQSNHGDIYPNSFGGNQFNHIPPLDAIERIEVIRGPASTLHGADAMGGLINIITKKVTDKWSGSVTVGRTFQENSSFGDDKTTDFSLRGPIVANKIGLAIRGSYYDREASNPEYAPSKAPDGTIIQRSLSYGAGGKTVDNQNKAIGFSLFITPDARQTITLDYDQSKQNYDNSLVKDPVTGIESPALGTLDTIDQIWRANNTACLNTLNCTRANPRGGYAEEQEFTRESWSLTHEGKWDFGKSLVSLSYVESDNNGRTLPFTVSERQHLLQMMNAQGAYAGMSLADRKAAAEAEFLPRPKRVMQSNQYTLDTKFDIPVSGFGGDHLLVMGSQIIDGELRDGVFGMEEGTPGKAQDHKMWALFLEDNWMPTDAFTLTSGVRYDKHDSFGDHLSPRVYGVYKFNSSWTAKGGISTGFKTPKTTDLYSGVVGFTGQGTTPQFGNPDLKPETSRNTELAIYWNHPVGHRFNATLFHNDFKDKIASQECGAGTGLTCSGAGEYEDLGYTNSSKKVNIDKVVIKGIELAGQWKISPKWSLRGNYTFTDSEQKSGENKGLPLGNSAKHMFNSTLGWQASSNINLYLTMEAHSKRYRGQIDNEASYYKDYQVFHLGARYELSKNVTLNARINNLLDKDFTTYKTKFVKDGTTYTATHTDDYNNKDKARSLWVSINARF